MMSWVTGLMRILYPTHASFIQSVTVGLYEPLLQRRHTSGGRWMSHPANWRSFTTVPAWGV